MLDPEEKIITCVDAEGVVDTGFPVHENTLKSIQFWFVQRRASQRIFIT